MAGVEKRVKPLLVKDPETGEEYTLEFSRESVKFAEQRKFNLSELTNFPATNIPALWFYAFRKNHRDVAREKTDRLLENLGGLTAAELERLVILYNQPVASLVITDPSERKNSKITVEL